MTAPEIVAMLQNKDKRIVELEAERDAAIKEISVQARARGLAEAQNESLRDLMAEHLPETYHHIHAALDRDGEQEESDGEL